MYIAFGVLTALIVIVAAVLLAAARQPREFSIARSILTAAPADHAFAFFSDLAHWRSWSPYEGRDPAMKTDLSSPSSGVGAAYAWNGNRNVGAGSLTVTNVTPGRAIEMDLEFERPFKCRNHVTWQVEEEAGQRRISWAMAGRNDELMPRIFGMFMNMDKMVGTDFENGLEKLKDLLENPQAL